MINWRKISEVGLPTDENEGYLVSDGVDIEYSMFETFGGFKWVGGSVYATYEESSNTEFEFYPTHWCPTSELNLPKS